MRVAIVCPYSLAVPGGVQSHVLALGRSLGDFGVEASVVAPTDGADMRDAGVRIVPLGRSFGLNVNGSTAPLALGPRVALRARTAVRGYDLVHVHEPLQFAVSLTATATAAHPVVGTFHAAAESMIWYAALRPLFAKAVARLDASWAVSEAAATLVQRYFGVRPPIEPNGVEVSRFARASALADRERATGPIILFVGRDEPRKGLDILLAAWPAVRTRVPGAELWAAGPGTEAVSGSGIRAFGAVDDAMLPRLYKSADLYCSPARFGESFGIVLLEAMAAGTPVVASDIAGYAAVARGGECARLVPVGDDAALADAIVSLAGDEAERERLGGAGRERAAEFDWAGVAARMAAHYEDVIASRRVR